MLGAEAFASLQAERPALMIRLRHKLLQGTGQTAVHLTAEVAAWDG